MAKSAEALEATIGYRFASRELLRQSLTHRSYISQTPSSTGHYERLEFLGDSILGFLASEHLVERFPESPEGQLTKLKAFLVRAENLVAVSRRLDLGAYLVLGRGEEAAGGRDKKGLLEDALEALIAAIYLDGGIDAARAFVRSAVLNDEALQAAEENLPLDNFKSALQEFLQARKLPAPVYTVAQEAGPPHDRTFTIEVGIGDLVRERARGASKKEASREAARLALDRIREVAAGAPVPDQTEATVKEDETEKSAPA